MIIEMKINIFFCYINNYITKKIIKLIKNMLLVHMFLIKIAQNYLLFDNMQL